MSELTRGLEEPALCAEVCLRGTRARTETMVSAPVLATSWLHTGTDDHAAMGQPMESLVDGLRQFPASEVVMPSGGEPGWEDAGAFAKESEANCAWRSPRWSPAGLRSRPRKLHFT